MIRYIIIVILILLNAGCHSDIQEKHSDTSLYQKSNRINIDPLSEKDPFAFVCQVYNNELFMIGAGCLISENIILTAAHIAQMPIQTVSFDNGKTHIKIQNIFLHEDFDITLSINDIAILLLEKEVDIKPIKLYTKDFTQCDMGIMLTMVGYPDGQKSFSNLNDIWLYGILQYSNDIRWLAITVHAVPGDSGGAVLLFEKNEFWLVGIISRVTIVGNLIIDTAATSVFKNLKWIEFGKDNIKLNDKNSLLLYNN